MDRRNAFGAGVREASFSVLRRARVQSDLQHIRDEKSQPDHSVQHAHPEHRSHKVSKPATNFTMIVSENMFFFLYFVLIRDSVTGFKRPPISILQEKIILWK